MKCIERGVYGLGTVVVCLVVSVLLMAGQTSAQFLVQPGDDCWTTDDACDGSTTVGFVDSPVPADFFGSGSDPFEGQIDLKGPNPGQTDTVVRRIDPIDLPAPGGACIIAATELVQLDLVSCQPVIVTYNGGQNPEEWDVAVGLSTVPAPTGILGACKYQPEGGLLEQAIVQVQARYTFTRIGDGQVVVLDTGEEVLPPIPLTRIANGYFLAGAAAADSPCDPGNFYAGARIVNEQVCCDPWCHAGPNPDHQHCVTPPGCPPCPAQPPIPAVSDWGLLGMALVVLVAGATVFARRRNAVRVGG